MVIATLFWVCKSLHILMQLYCLNKLASLHKPVETQLRMGLVKYSHAPLYTCPLLLFLWALIELSDLAFWLSIEHLKKKTTLFFFRFQSSYNKLDIQLVQVKEVYNTLRKLFFQFPIFVPIATRSSWNIQFKSFLMGTQFCCPINKAVNDMTMLIGWSPTRMCMGTNKHLFKEQ